MDTLSSKSTSGRSRSRSVGSDASVFELSGSLRSLSVSSSPSATSSRSLQWVIRPLKKKVNFIPGYLGLQSRKSAEKKMGELKFAVYHQLPFSPMLDNLEEKAVIACVYRSSADSFSHFAIREHTNWKGTFEYFLEAGASKKPKMFETIEDLLTYYSKNSQ